MEHIDQMYAELRASANKLRTAERRARFERAYMARASTLNGDYGCWGDMVEDCAAFALETVRQWDAMMAQLDGEEG